MCRSASSSGTAAVKQWSDNPEASHQVPLQSQEGSSSGSYEQGHRRSNSSETLLDRHGTAAEDGGQRSSMPVRNARNGPYKSSEAIMDTTLKQAQRSSPERQVNGHAELACVHSAAGGRGMNGGVGYSEILMDYVWGSSRRYKLNNNKDCRCKIMQKLGRGLTVPMLLRLPTGTAFPNRSSLSWETALRPTAL